MTKPTRDEALAHFGVKGMRWGVRNEDDLGSSPKNQAKITKEEYTAILKKQSKGTKAQDAIEIAKNKEKFKAKFESTDKIIKPKPNTTLGAGSSAKKGWRPTKKQLAIAGIGAAYVGLVAASYYVDSKQYGSFTTVSPSRVSDSLKLKAITPFVKPGEHCSFNAYQKLIDGSVSRSWGAKGYFNEYSYDRPELVFPAGHIFHRLSYGDEKTFGTNGNYCTTSKLELARYLASSEFGHKPKHITWTAETEVRVPKLSTVLETARAALTEYTGKEATATEAFAWYRQQSGGSWDKTGTTAGIFFEMLKNQGYHAIIDEMDAGVYSEHPLVWFANESASAKRSENVTKELLAEAKSILTEIEHRK